MYILRWSSGGSRVIPPDGHVALQVCLIGVCNQPLDRARATRQDLLSIYHAVCGIKRQFPRGSLYTHFSEPTNEGLLHPLPDGDAARLAQTVALVKNLLLSALETAIVVEVIAHFKKVDVRKKASDF